MNGSDGDNHQVECHDSGQWHKNRQAVEGCDGWRRKPENSRHRDADHEVKPEDGRLIDERGLPGLYQRRGKAAVHERAGDRNE